MRQAGVLAAACVYALDHNVDRLAEDHRNARALADGLAELPGVEVDPVETNIVLFSVPDAPGLAERLADRVEVYPVGPGRMRAVTHLDVDRDGIERALAAFREELA